MHGVLKRGVGLQQQHVCRFKLLPAPSPCANKGCRQPINRSSTRLAASADGNAQQQRSDLPQQQESAAVQPAVEPEQLDIDESEQQWDDYQLDPETEAALAAAYALGDEQAAEEELLLHQPSWEVDHAAHKTAAYAYAAMTVGLSASGLLVALYAAPIASSCLNLGGMPAVQAAALVGCAGAGLIRAASLALYLAVSYVRCPAVSFDKSQTHAHARCSV